jgi:hypothetical protein
MQFQSERVVANVRKATTDDLMDRVTDFRAGLEPAAVPIIMEELRARGVTPEAVLAHEDSQAGVLVDQTGTACQCGRCRKPAVIRVWGWHRLFGKVPIFPRRVRLCKEHAPPQADDDC